MVWGGMGSDGEGWGVMARAEGDEKYRRAWARVERGPVEVDRDRYRWREMKQRVEREGCLLPVEKDNAGKGWRTLKEDGDGWRGMGKAGEG